MYCHKVSPWCPDWLGMKEVFIVWKFTPSTLLTTMHDLKSDIYVCILEGSHVVLLIDITILVDNFTHRVLQKIQLITQSLGQNNLF